MKAFRVCSSSCVSKMRVYPPGSTGRQFPHVLVSRTDFIKNFNSPQMTQLRKFLLDTVAEQTQFLVMRAQSAIDKILDSTPESNEREHIITQFTRIVQASKDLYPLIDYVNFKGEGTDPAETALDKETGE